MSNQGLGTTETECLDDGDNEEGSWALTDKRERKDSRKSSNRKIETDKIYILSLILRLLTLYTNSSDFLTFKTKARGIYKSESCKRVKYWDN